LGSEGSHAAAGRMGGSGAVVGWSAATQERRAVASACRTGACPWTGEAGVADRWGHDHCNGRRRFNLIQISNSNKVQIVSNFDQSKKDFPKLKFFKIKYGCEYFEERNNFLHRNFFRLGMDFKLKKSEKLLDL
jgi:hypothetical protein